ncbi:deoxyribonuclease IV [Streptomyces sp. DSM 44915]|uniref:Probable endonuclease 4 n=1 Tax=Streptomyces chisholmiae TaxID=3075540 RepID=A0ABU2JIY0_9ACTN|nr:deoxyribonuclease IV [Streptomyces sp. DSM 44915]MDT0264947.1 deoxyribonuclease IV [Streptomyces sp. DSM 44915]
MPPQSPRPTSPPPVPPPRNPIGGHVPVAGGLAAVGVRYARTIGAEALQVFVANPRGWATPPGSPAQDAAFRAACATEALPAYVHAPYLINLGSHSTETAERSVVSLRHSLHRARAIGALGVVVHTGSATGSRPRQVALDQAGRLLRPLLAELDALAEDGSAVPRLLLEPTAGQGFSLCSRVADLGPYLAAVDHHPRVGVCLDTCHVFAAGHDLSVPGGATALLDELTRVAGPGRLGLVHANDSKAGVGSRLDRHQNVGAGAIGEAAFAELLRHPATAGVPLVIETPGGTEGHAGDIARLKALRC